jgi:hypothetical protein
MWIILGIAFLVLFRLAEKGFFDDDREEAAPPARKRSPSMVTWTM